LSKDHKRRTAQLLARGRLPGQAREEVLERVLRDPSVSGARRPWRLPLAFGLPAVAAMALFVSFRSREGDDTLRAKGASDVRPRVEIVCTAMDGPACRRDGKLLIQVDPLPQGGFVEAYLTPASSSSDGAPAERLWLSPPHADASTVAVPASASSQILGVGVDLSALQPGTYRAHLRLFSRALSRTELRGLGDEGAISVSDLPLTVLP